MRGELNGTDQPVYPVLSILQYIILSYFVQNNSYNKYALRERVTFSQKKKE
jgi:hypothetical protein